MKALIVFTGFVLLCAPPLARAQAQAGATTPVPPQTQEVKLQTTFSVRYVATDAVYIAAGRSSGLSQGMILVIKAPPTPAPKPIPSAQGKTPPAEAPEADAIPHVPEPVAKLRVISVAETSAVCEIISTTRPIVGGDIVTLPSDEVEKLVAKRSLSSTRDYPAVVSFTEGDPLDEEVRAEVPRPPSPAVNQASGRFGFDFANTRSAGGSSSLTGFVVRTDINRIGGTYWNLTGYWRGEFQRQSSSVIATQQDMLNRTYLMGLFYNNPNSRWLFGIGRLYLPWATSIGSIDGGYAGRKLSRHATVGMFAGLQQDPLAWNYNPNRHVGGGFINFDGGSYDAFKWSSTFGGGLDTIVWNIDRPFVFSENTFSWKRVVTIYHAAQFDKPSVGPGQTAVGAGLQSSYFSVRVQPVRRVSFDLNDSYFRDVPTFDPILVGTGLLDKVLFQGLSGGVRVELPMHLTVFTNIGRNSSSGDAKSSWNTSFGASLARIWKTGMTLDLRYSKFNSVFAQGQYQSFTLSRNITDKFRLQLTGGKQAYTAAQTTDTGTKFATFSLDTIIGKRYFFQANYGIQRGASLNYDQMFVTFGYRFDNRHNFVRENNNGTHK